VSSAQVVITCVDSVSLGPLISKLGPNGVIEQIQGPVVLNQRKVVAGPLTGRLVGP
jgi:hypothetical protein